MPYNVWHLNFLRGCANPKFVEHTLTRRWNEWETLLRLLPPEQTYHASEEQGWLSTPGLSNPMLVQVSLQVEASFFELHQDDRTDQRVARLWLSPSVSCS